MKQKIEKKVKIKLCKICKCELTVFNKYAGTALCGDCFKEKRKAQYKVLEYKPIYCKDCNVLIEKHNWVKNKCRCRDCNNKYHKTTYYGRYYEKKSEKIIDFKNHALYGNQLFHDVIVKKYGIVK